MKTGRSTFDGAKLYKNNLVRQIPEAVNLGTISIWGQPDYMK